MCKLQSLILQHPSWLYIDTLNAGKLEGKKTEKVAPSISLSSKSDIALHMDIGSRVIRDYFIVNCKFKKWTFLKSWNAM